ncbi:MAG: outer membrane beta-barrel protein [Desulfuromonadaceae bacterium]|nr:outer membrane beta-barrel protein [Desulfuromonadaceae bacterium]
MKKTSILFLLLAVVLFGITSPVSAEEKPASETASNYVLLKGGMYSPSMTFDLNNFNGGTTSHFDSKTGFAGEVAIGHYFLPMLAVELAGGYFESKGSPAAGPGDTKLRVIPMIATGKVLLPLGIFEPYGLAGIGAYFTNMEVSNNTGSVRGSTEVTYGFHAGAGFNINLHNHMFLGLEGKYLWAEPSFGGQHVQLDGFITTADIGFRF